MSLQDQELWMHESTGPGALNTWIYRTIRFQYMNLQDQELSIHEPTGPEAFNTSIYRTRSFQYMNLQDRKLSIHVALKTFGAVFHVPQQTTQQIWWWRLTHLLWVNTKRCWNKPFQWKCTMGSNKKYFYHNTTQQYHSIVPKLPFWSDNNVAHKKHGNTDWTCQCCNVCLSL